MADIDPYAVLGLSPGATPEQVRGAFRRAVRGAHPDTSSSRANDSRVRDVIEAYRLLVDPAARARYDADHASSSDDIPVPRVDVRPATTPGRSAAPAPCSECRGSGMVTSVATCPACRGLAEITALEATHARIVRCRACRGSGRVLLRRSCQACKGTGTMSPPATPPR